MGVGVTPCMIGNGNFRQDRVQARAWMLSTLISTLALCMAVALLGLEGAEGCVNAGRIEAASC